MGLFSENDFIRRRIVVVVGVGVGEWMVGIVTKRLIHKQGCRSWPVEELGD